MMLRTHVPEVFQVGNKDRDSFYEVGIYIYEAMAGWQQKGQQKDPAV